MNGKMADPNNPFAQSEMAMDRAMMAPVGVSAQDSWVRKIEKTRASRHRPSLLRIRTLGMT